MSRNAYFYHQDPGCPERQSIGVYLAKDAQEHIREPIFYCPEYSIIWIGVDSLQKGGDRSKDPGKLIIEPLSLQEIVDLDLIALVDGVIDAQRNVSIRLG